MSRSRTIMVMPDVHAPIHDRRGVSTFLDILADVQPDELCIIGDFMDCAAPARWNKAAAEEYVAGLDREAAAAREILGRVRKIFDGHISFILGNHEDRIYNYMVKYAPAFVGIVPMVPELLGFEEHGIALQGQPYRIAPGTVAIHGKRLASAQNSAGQSAYKERSRFGQSIVQGHTHRLGIGWDTQERSRFWMEVGCLIDFNRADYLEFPKDQPGPAWANWQHGFGLLTVHRGFTYPEVIALHNGRAVVHGKTY